MNAKVKTGDRAEIHCDVASGQNTLTRIEKRRESPSGRHVAGSRLGLCRNIKILYNFSPPTTQDEVDAAAGSSFAR